MTTTTTATARRATASDLRIGAHFVIQDDTDYHQLPIGTEVVQVNMPRSEGSYFLVTTNLAWTPADAVPSHDQGRDTPGGFRVRNVSPGDISPVAGPTAIAPTYSPVTADTITRGTAYRVRQIGSTSFVVGQTVYAVRPAESGGSLWLFAANPVPADADVSTWNNGSGALNPERGARWWAYASDVELITPQPDTTTPVAPTPAATVDPTPVRGEAWRVLEPGSASFSVGQTVYAVRPMLQGSTSWLWSSTPVDAARDVSRLEAGTAAGRWWVNTTSMERIVTSTTPMPTAAGNDVDALRRERDAAVSALAAFKRKVREVATAEADKRGWCDEIDTVLASIEPGLARISSKVIVTIPVTVEIEVDARSGVGEGCYQVGGLDESIRALDWSRAFDSCYSGTRVRTRSVTLGDRTERAETETPVTEVLTGSHPFREGERYRVLANPRRGERERETERVPREGTIVTVAKDGVDEDGDVVLERPGYASAGDGAEWWVRPRFLAPVS